MIIPTDEDRNKNAQLAKSHALKIGLRDGIIAGIISYGFACVVQSKKWDNTFKSRYKIWLPVMGFCAIFGLRYEQTAIEIAKNPPWIDHPPPFKLTRYEELNKEKESS